MILNRRWLAVAAMAALTVSCSKKPKPQEITPEAAQAFGLAEVGGMGGSLVVDAEKLRQLGFVGTAEPEVGNLLLDFTVNLLPAAAAEMTSEPEAAAVLGRTAVLLALVREWAIAPYAQRLGVVVQIDPANPDASVHKSLVLLAVREGEEANRELLQGIGAAVRAASGRGLVKSEKGNVCVAAGAIPDLPFQVCLHAAPGLIALGTPEALASLADSPAAAADRKSGPAIRLLVSLPAQGHGELRVDGSGELRVSARFEPEDPKLADAVEQGAKKVLETLDAQREKSVAVMSRGLEQVRTAIDEDADAPGRMKAAVKKANAEKLLDPRGEYAAMRRSMKIGRDGDTVTAELTIPEGQAQRYLRQQGTVTTVAVIGIVAAIAIPNYLKYQCRSKASEGRLALRTARTAMDAYKAEHGADAKRLEEVDYQPLPSGKYTVCARTGCLPPAAPAAVAQCEEAFGALPAEDGGPALCAAGEIDGKPDVWLLDAQGEAAPYHSACQ